VSFGDWVKRKVWNTASKKVTVEGVGVILDYAMRARHGGRKGSALLRSPEFFRQHHQGPWGERNERRPECLILRVMLRVEDEHRKEEFPMLRCTGAQIKRCLEDT